VCGVGLAFYTVVALAAFLLEGELRRILGRRSMQHAIDVLDRHVVVCGYGRLGRAVAEKLKEYVNNASPVDKWGHDLVFYCGSGSVPAGVHTGFAVKSLGPDGVARSRAGICANDARLFPIEPDRIGGPCVRRCLNDFAPLAGGTADDTNERFRFLLGQGQTGLSTATVSNIVKIMQDSGLASTEPTTYLPSPS